MDTTQDVLPPPFEWITIPGGSVALAIGDSFEVRSFAIGRYVVTNAQFSAFEDAVDGFANPGWWDFSGDAQAWRADHPRPAETAFPGDTLPRTVVTWYEAMAFCRWLSHKTGRVITLPAEQQWQRAAQGDDNRAYPWGNSFNPARCFFDAAGAGDVSRFPQAASPYGVLGLSGNVWEWCRGQYEKPYQNDPAMPVLYRVLRGGSWWCSDPDDLRVNARNGGPPHAWSHDWGFRICRLD